MICLSFVVPKKNSGALPLAQTTIHSNDFANIDMHDPRD